MALVRHSLSCQWCEQLRGADFFASKDTSGGRSFEPRDRGARGDVLGPQKGAKWKSGEPGEATVSTLCFEKIDFGADVTSEHALISRRAAGGHRPSAAPDLLIIS